MSCDSVQNSLSAHLDGRVPPGVKQGIVTHLNHCPQCRSQLEQMSRVRSALRALPAVAPPPKLDTALRVMASRERARVLNRRGQFESLVARMRLCVDNLMRPLALPFAGGLTSALALFSILIPNFVVRPIAAGSDIPLAGFSEPAIKAQMPFSFDNDTADFVIEVVVDGQGRMADYAIVQGPSLANNPGLKRLIERKLLFTEFTPATMFGRPTAGRMYISFQCERIDIKS
jgi:hypothetical protein